MSTQRFVHAIIAAAILLSIPAFANAQEVGLKAGLNSTYFLPEEDDEAHFYSWRRGPVAGVWFGVPLTTRFPLQVEVLFSEKGVRFDGRPVGLDAVADVRIRYLEIPLLARANFGSTTSRSQAFVIAGVAPALSPFRGKAVKRSGSRPCPDESCRNDLDRTWYRGLMSRRPSR